jgi:hypothetical protein
MLNSRHSFGLSTHDIPLRVNYGQLTSWMPKHAYSFPFRSVKPPSMHQHRSHVAFFRLQHLIPWAAEVNPSGGYKAYRLHWGLPSINGSRVQWPQQSRCFLTALGSRSRSNCERHMNSRNNLGNMLRYQNLEGLPLQTSSRLGGDMQTSPSSRSFQHTQKWVGGKRK